MTFRESSLLAMNRGMESIGPGRYRATIAVISSMELGFMLTHTPVMPADSSWNTPWVLPSASMAKVSASSSGILHMAKSGLILRICFSASSMTVRFRRPRKSIFSRPSSSMVVMVYWVTTVSSLQDRGT